MHYMTVFPTLHHRAPGEPSKIWGPRILAEVRICPKRKKTMRPCPLWW